MRYPGSKGIHVMSIIIIIWFRFHTAHINNDIIILISNKRIENEARMTSMVSIILLLILFGFGFILLTLILIFNKRAK